jgi:hypothetical protein
MTRAPLEYIQPMLISSFRAFFSMSLPGSCLLPRPAHLPLDIVLRHSSFGFEVLNTTIEIVHSQTASHCLLQTHEEFRTDIPPTSRESL